MKKTLSLLLIMLLSHAFGPISLATDGPAEKARKAMLAAEVKAGVASVGAGKSSRVRVLLKDKTKYDGYVKEIGEDYFVIADFRTGAAASISYAEVKGIRGNNLSTGAKIGIGVGIAAAAALLIAIIAGRGDEEKAPPSQCQPSGVTSPCPPGCVCTQ